MEGGGRGRGRGRVERRREENGGERGFTLLQLRAHLHVQVWTDL